MKSLSLSLSTPIGQAVLLILLLVNNALAVSDPKCLDHFIEKVGLTEADQTSPTIIKGILKNEMHLYQVELVRHLLQSELNTKHDLWPLIQEIKQGIIKNQPPMLNFICAAQEQNLFPEELTTSQKIIIKRVIMRTYILQAITEAMIHDSEFFDMVVAQLTMERAKSLINKKGDIGIPLIVKIFSVDLGFFQFQKVKSRGYMTDSEKKNFWEILKLNITEADLLELATGNHYNAMVGQIMNETPYPFANAWVEAPYQFIKYPVTQKYATLYQNWNFAFMLGNASYFDLFAPKLLIPIVMNAAGEDYLYNRVVSLWLTLNFILFAKTENRQDFSAIPKNKELAALWAKFTYQYAIDVNQK